MKKKNMTKQKLTPGLVLIYLAMIIYTIFLFFPLMTVVITSFVPSIELAQSDTFVWMAQNPTIQGYIEIFTNDRFLMTTGLPGLVLGFINTLWITLIPLIVGLMMSGLAGYAFSKLDFPGKEFLFKFTIVAQSIPLGAFAVISYVFYSAIGWTGDRGFLPLLIPGMLGSVGTVFFLRLFFDGIPNSLVEAARLDGAGFFQTFFTVIFPLGKPAFISQFIFGFVGGYNNYIGPMLYLQGQDRYVTLQLYLSQIQGLFRTAGSENIHCAAAILGMLPLIIIYCFMQRFFLEGITVGSVKE